jgi:hypothetical protein
MFNDEISYIFEELNTLSLEKNLVENLKIISLLYDSSRIDDTKKYLRRVSERILQLSKSRDVGYALYVSLLVLNFFKEAKKYNKEIFNNEGIFIEMTVFFDYLDKILKKTKTKNDDNLEKRNETIEISGTFFADEYGYKKSNKIVNKQLNLPF